MSAMLRSLARSKGRLVVLVVLFTAAVASQVAVAGKPGGGGGLVPPGTIYFLFPEDVWSMKADGSGKFPASPDHYSAAPTTLVYGNDRHRLWLDTGTIPGQFYPYYPDPSQNTTERRELFAYRSTPAGEVQKVQITNLFPGIRVDGYCQWSNDGADSFVSFKGFDARLYFVTGNQADLRHGIFRARVSGADIDAAADAGQDFLLGIDDLETVESVSFGSWPDDLNHSWSPDGNQVAMILRSGDPGDYGDLFVKDLTTGQTRLLYARPDNEFPPTFHWSPGGGKLALGGGGSIYTIDAGTGALLQTLVQPYRFTTYARPFWSPDGKQLVVEGIDSKLNGHQYSLYRLPATGGSLTFLTGDLDTTIPKYPIGWVSDEPASP